MFETVLGYLVGICVGVVLGLLGGGGSLLLPALLYILDMPLHLATAYTTILVGVTAVFGMIPWIRRRQVDIPTVFALGIPVSFGMFLVRRWLFDWLPAVLFSVGSFDVTKKMFILTLFATILVLSFATLNGFIGKRIKSRANLRVEKPVLYYSSLVVCGLLIGILPGFTGSGGGVLIVPLLVIFFGLPMKTVVGTSLAIIAMKSFVGFFGGDFVRLGDQMDFTFLWTFSIVMVAGALLGSRIAQHADGERLKKMFGWFILGLAVFIVAKEVLFVRPEPQAPIQEIQDVPVSRPQNQND